MSLDLSVIKQSACEYQDQTKNEAARNEFAFRNYSLFDYLDWRNGEPEPGYKSYYCKRKDTAVIKIYAQGKKKSAGMRAASSQRSPNTPYWYWTYPMMEEKASTREESIIVWKTGAWHFIIRIRRLYPEYVPKTSDMRSDSRIMMTWWPIVSIWDK